MITGDNRQRAPKRLHFPDFTKNVAITVAEKAFQAYSDKKVISVTRLMSTHYRCIVRGDTTRAEYTVEVVISSQWVEKRSCTCVRAKFSVCIHVIAALFQITNGGEATNDVEVTNDVRNKPVPLYPQTNDVSPYHSQSSIDPQPLFNPQLSNLYPFDSKSHSKHYTISQGSKLSQRSVTFSDLGRHTPVEENIAAEEASESEEDQFFKELTCQIVLNK